MLQATALASSFTLFEITGQAVRFNSTHYQPFVAYIPAAIVFDHDVYFGAGVPGAGKTLFGAFASTFALIVGCRFEKSMKIEYHALDGTHWARPVI